METAITTVLLLLSGFCSGSTIGLTGLSKQSVARLAQMGNKDAQKLLPIVEDKTKLLITLLVGNTLVNSALSVFLGGFLQGAWAILLSTVLIVIIGEIIPAILITKYALKFGAFVAKPIKGMIIVLTPVTFVITYTLKKIFGDEVDEFYCRKELELIIDEHVNSEKSNLNESEGKIIKSALTLSDKTIEDIQVDISKVFSVDAYSMVDNTFLDCVKSNGYTRIPVADDGVIIGVINIKLLIGSDWEGPDGFGHKQTRDIMDTNKLLYVDHEDSILDTLNAMTENKIHMAVVVKDGVQCGLCTLEDLVEEILDQEIEDETD